MMLDAARAKKLEALCEAIVPGSTRVGPLAYIAALLAAMPEPVRNHALAAIDALSPDTLAEQEHTPEFGDLWDEMTSVRRSIAGATW